MSPEESPPNVITLLGEPTIELEMTGLRVYSYLDGRIKVLEGTSATREAVDAFVEQARQYFERCLANREPVLYMVHITQAMAMTPYTKHRLDTFNREYAHIIGRGAYIFPNSAIMRFIKNFVMYFQTRQWKHVDFREFKDVESALEWLYEGYLNDTLPDA